MKVRVSERVETIIEQSIEGQKLADELEEKLRSQGAFRGRREDTKNIVLAAEYHMNVQKVRIRSERSNT